DPKSNSKTVASNISLPLYLQNHKMKRLHLLFFIILLFQIAFGQKQKLGFNLLPGQTYYHSMQTSSNVQQDLNGQKVIIDITLTGKIAFKIIDIKDSIYDIDVRYQKLAMKMKLPNREMSFNSEKKDTTDVFSNVLGAIIDKQFLMKMTKTGKIVEVKNIDSIFDKSIENFSNLTLLQKQQIKVQLMQAFGEKSFKGSFEMITAIYSNAAVDKSDTWIIKTKLESAQSATVTTTFEFKDKIENYNIIIGTGEIETLDRNAITQINGMPAKYNLKGTMNSTLKVDNKTGWVADAKIIQSISGNAEIEDNPKLPGGMIIPMSIVTGITYSAN
ncbi:MAG: DUF6263 family protein, partial [Ferruginibacter sp.]